MKTNQITLINLSEVELWKENYRKGDLDAIKASIRAFGFRSAVKVWHGTVMAGNHAIKALRELREEGWKPDGADLLQISNKGWFLPAIDISNLSEEEAKAFAIADNRTQELGENLDQELYDLLSSFSDPSLLEATGYDDASIAEILASLNEQAPPQQLGRAPEPQLDRAEELREKWGVEYGQLWEVGRHRILCGDSNLESDSNRLVRAEIISAIITDPPYGMALNTDYASMPKTTRSFTPIVGEVVLDLFAGSGVTLCAAELTNRRCLAMEIEPKYVAVTIERLAEMGLEPKLLS